MNCPYCHKTINAFTGFQEAAQFQKHLAKCRKNPANIVLMDGRRTAVSPIKPQSLLDALSLRAKSGQ